MKQAHRQQSEHEDNQASTKAKATKQHKDNEEHKDNKASTKAKATKQHEDNEASTKQVRNGRGDTCNKHA